MSDRRLRVAAFVVAFVVSALLTACAYTGGLHTSAASAALTGQQRWYQLSPQERQRCVEWHRNLYGRSDYRDLLRQARSFAALSEADRDRLRYLNGVLVAVIEEQPVSRRRALLALPQRARAVEVYRSLEQDSPARLAEIRAELARRR